MEEISFPPFLPLPNPLYIWTEGVYIQFIPELTEVYWYYAMALRKGPGEAEDHTLSSLPSLTDKTNTSSFKPWNSVNLS
jgi:hypothetical protein